MAVKTDWVKAIQPLLKKYKGQKHPLEYKSTYQLVVMVVLAAQDSDRNINKLAVDLFKSYSQYEGTGQTFRGNIDPAY